MTEIPTELTVNYVDLRFVCVLFGGGGLGLFSGGRL